ncbi:hypothetical protein EWB00_000041 [Schistosoma japonicum]|uniref:Uncharacterized protein n=1 Tax=Schistosoma japonicum TaxID=6182 RepID=A0A4Z2CL46_SCHJA|nr:hypothetical protein EWB00_000041 [Schistosoma japonicum]
MFRISKWTNGNVCHETLRMKERLILEGIKGLYLNGRLLQADSEHQWNVITWTQVTSPVLKLVRLLVKSMINPTAMTLIVKVTITQLLHPVIGDYHRLKQNMIPAVMVEVEVRKRERKRFTVTATDDIVKVAIVIIVGDINLDGINLTIGPLPTLCRLTNIGMFPPPGFEHVTPAQYKALQTSGQVPFNVYAAVKCLCQFMHQMLP